jgi:hypothetical protein
MNRLRFIWFDVKNGILREWRRYLVAFIIFGLLSISLTISVQPIAPLYEMSSSLTFGDYLVNMMCGMKEYMFDPSNPFSFPAAWMLAFLFMAYITLNYPYHDLMGMGKHLIIVSGSRTLWWLSKCVWVALSVLSFFLVGFASSALWTLISGGDFSFDVSEIVPIVLQFDTTILLPRPWDMTGLLLAVPLMTVALCCVQLLLSLLIRPMFSYIVTIGVLFLSAYFQSPWLIGNYMMAARSICFVDGGLSWQIGAAISCVLIAAVVVMGGVLFNRLDILDWEQ